GGREVVAYVRLGGVDAQRLSKVCGRALEVTPAEENQGESLVGERVLLRHRDGVLEESDAVPPGAGLIVGADHQGNGDEAGKGRGKDPEWSDPSLDPPSRAVGGDHPDGRRGALPELGAAPRGDDEQS